MARPLTVVHWLGRVVGSLASVPLKQKFLYELVLTTVL